MLLKIKQFLAGKNMASLGEIARHCDADSDAVREALKIWIQKGAVHKVEIGEHCKGCSALCLPTKDMEIYEWYDR
jgi:hypothetical protein